MMKEFLATFSLSKMRHRLKHERGAVLVEAAICIPLLLVVIFGAVEAGLAWEAKSATISGVRTGTLRAASDAEDPGVDLRIIQSVISEVGGNNVDRIDEIVIFEVLGADPDASFANCLAGAGTCVSYNATNIQGVASGAVTIADFDNGSGTSTTDAVTGEVIDYQCATGFLDSGWCALERVDDGDVQLGVGIRYTHDWLTGIFPFGPPNFEEYVTSSTFTDGGVDIDPNTPVALPFSDFSDLTFNFDSNPNNLGVPDMTFNDTNSNFSGSQWTTNGPVGTNQLTLTLTNLDPGSPVCVDFDVIGSGGLDGPSSAYADPFTVSVEGTAGDTQYINGAGTIEFKNQCGIANASGEVVIQIIGTTTGSGEAWSVDDLRVTSKPAP